MAATWRGQYFKYKEFSLNLIAVYKNRPDVKAFLEIILSLSTLIIFILFALKPTALTMISLYQDINEKKKTLNSLNQKINDLQTANAVFIQNQKYIPDIDNAIFTNPKPDILAKQIIGVANKNSVRIESFSIGQIVLVGKGTLSDNNNNPANAISKDSPLPENVKSMPINISIKGGYLSLSGFIKDLENLRIPVKIDLVSINKIEGTGGSILIESISARVPFIGQE